MSIFAKHLLFSSIATLSLFSTALIAEETTFDPSAPLAEERAKIRVREIDPNKLESVKRRRAEENGEVISDVQKSSNLMHKTSARLAHNNSQWTRSLLNESQPQYTLTSAYLSSDAHWFTKVANNWLSFEIEDGSRWEIPHSDQHILYNWHRDDILVISPNTSWFAAYDYFVTNTTNNTYVKANLLEGPILFGPYSHWVVDIDYLGGHIYLENQTVWCMDPKDSALLDDWAINDHVIVGANETFYSKYNRILINVKMEDYLRARQY